MSAQKFNFVRFECGRRDTLSVLDVCKVADMVLLVYSPSPLPVGMSWACLLGLVAAAVLADPGGGRLHSLHKQGKG